MKNITIKFTYTYQAYYLIDIEKNQGLVYLIIYSNLIL